MTKKGKCSWRETHKIPNPRDGGPTELTGIWNAIKFEFFLQGVEHYVVIVSDVDRLLQYVPGWPQAHNLASTICCIF